MMFNKLCIIGVGLIGGSIAKTARKQQLCQTISAYGREHDVSNLQRAQALQVIDSFSLEMATAVSDADCIIIATPVGAMPSILKQLAPFWRKDCLYMDAGSTKGNIVNALFDVLGYFPDNFVPAHPIAGAENSGVGAAVTDLFVGKKVIFTPLQDTQPVFIEAAQAFWQALGSDVSCMGVEQHDTVLAATSHLPHILAFTLLELLGKKDEQADIFKYAASGFKDFTRIASSDPTMWQDICLANKQQLVPLIEQMCDRLNDVKQTITENKTDILYTKFTYARDARARFLAYYK